MRKRKIVTAALLTICLVFVSLLSTSCSLFEDEQKAAERELTTVFSLIDKRDKDGLLKRYAESARSQNPDIGDEIDAFFEVIDGKITVERFWCYGSNAGQFEYGKRALWFSGIYEVIILIGGVRYHVNLYFCSINTIDKNERGIFTLEFATEEAYNSPYFVWHFNTPYDTEDDDLPGFYCQSSAEKRGDILFVEEGYFIFKQFDRQLTKEQLIEAADISDDYFGSFINIVGEANSKWVIWKYYYYLLSDGTVAVIVLNDDLLPLAEGGRHIKPNDIGAIYLATDEAYLETIWLAPNIAVENDTLNNGRERYYYNNNA